ncbi:MAG TPA: hypothetical protein VFT98_10915 [Myxococcota bacterium]|nr:hypothetical protein [Myxococcota bacterium]
MSISRRLKGQVSTVRRLAALTSLLAIPLLSTQAHGATIGVLTGYNYSFTGGGSPFVAGGETTVLPSQGTSTADGSTALGGSAAADFIALRAGAFATGTATHVCQCISMGAQVNMFAVSQDILHPAAGATTMSITLSVSGTNLATLTGAAGPLAVSARTSLNVVTFDPSAIEDVDTTGPVTGLQFFRHETFANNVSFPRTLTVPVTSASGVGVWLELISVAEGSVVAGSFQATTDFTATVRIIAIELFDANGQPLANPTLTSDSGTLYPLVGVAEPHAAWLLGLGAFVVASRPRAARHLA